MSISILIPCRNEERNIGNTTNYLQKNLKKIKYEIILINDFSSDKTLNTIKKISKKSRKIKCLDNKRPGLGSVVSIGIKKAKYDYVCIYMADRSDDYRDLIKYYKNIKSSKVDAIFGSRFLKNSNVKDYPFKKLILNRLANYFIKILFISDYNDFTNAFKIYKKNTLRKLYPIVSESFNVFLELPLKIITRKYTYKIVPINWTNRKKGVSKFKIKELRSKYLFTLFYCFLEKVLINK